MAETMPHQPTRPACRARLVLLGEALGLQVGATQNITGAEQADTQVSLANGSSLVLVDYDGDFGFTQIDIL